MGSIDHCIATQLAWVRAFIDIRKAIILQNINFTKH
jgi:hypothetical protein